MGKGAAGLGLLLIIIGILPILLGMLNMFPEIAALFDLGFYSLDLAGYVFTEVMLILLGLGIVLLIVGAAR
ncbi:MAG: hypothetical protein JSW61_11415 [Candidatus Thorarchaeota archaeon]|nr:MAG: hypothetical protein JSW61_11415 [Candidatus Thorarchaeota archaeon]